MQKKFKKSLKAIQANQEEIKKLEDKNKKMTSKLIRKIIKHLENWLPEYNEKCICIGMSSATAWHMWFYKRYDDGALRFKESPISLNEGIQHFATQRMDMPKNEIRDWVIVPISLFNKINQNNIIYLESE